MKIVHLVIEQYVKTSYKLEVRTNNMGNIEVDFDCDIACVCGVGENIDEAIANFVVYFVNYMEFYNNEFNIFPNDN